MAKWTGKIKTVKRWLRSPKYLVQYRKEDGDHNPPECLELYWCEVDALRLDFIAFELQCRRSEVETLTNENNRLRGKLVSLGSDPKPPVAGYQPLPTTGDHLASPPKEM